MKIHKHNHCNCHRLHENNLQQLHEGTKYDKKAATKLANSGLFDEETSTRIVNALFKEDIHAFVHSPAWLEKYLIGIVNMLIKHCDGDRSKAQGFLTDSIGNFEEYLTYIKELRPTLDDAKKAELDKTFNEEMSYEDMVKELNDIKAQRDAESAEILANTEFDNNSDFELVPIESFEDFNSKFGGRATGDGSSDAYAGGGGTAWCHTNSNPTYNNWVSGGKKFFVLAHKDWKNIPFDKESNSNNPKDAYGNSLIAILVSKGGRLLKATLRCNHIGVPSNADNQYNTYAELSEVVGFNVEEAVKESLGLDPDTEDEEVITCDNCGVVIEDNEGRTTPDAEVWCDDCFFDRYDYCYECDTVIDKDYDWYNYGPNGSLYCDSCFNEYYFVCDYCGETYDLDDVIETPDGWYCEECAERKGWIKCSDCGEVVGRDWAYAVDDEWYCEDCYNDNFFYCDKCETDYSRDEMNDTPDGPVCDYCFEHYYFTCEKCGQVVRIEDSYFPHGEDGMCEDCLEKYTFECESCGEYFANSLAVETSDGDTVCQDCYVKYYQDDDMDEDMLKPTKKIPTKETFDDLEDNTDTKNFLEKFGI